MKTKLASVTKTKPLASTLVQPIQPAQPTRSLTTTVVQIEGNTTGLSKEFGALVESIRTQSELGSTICRACIQPGTNASHHQEETLVLKESGRKQVTLEHHQNGACRRISLYLVEDTSPDDALVAVASTFPCIAPKHIQQRLATAA